MNGAGVPGGASMTKTDPAGTVSTKCAESFGEDVSDPGTIWTVYAGLQTRTSVGAVDGETMLMSGRRPPAGTESLINASDISQVEKSASRAVDMARNTGRSRERVGCIGEIVRGD